MKPLWKTRSEEFFRSCFPKKADSTMGSTTKFSVEQESQIRKEYEAGESAAKIAQRWSSNAGTILNALRNAGGSVRRCKVYDVTRDEENSMISAYFLGSSAKAAAAPLGLSESACLDTLRRRGLGPRKPGSKRNHQLNEGFFAQIDTPAKARWLGWLAADGCVSEKSRGHSLRLEIGVKAEDAGHLEAFAAAIGFSGSVRLGLSHCKGRTYPRARIGIYSTQLCNDLVRHGVVPLKSYCLQPWVGCPRLLRFWFAGLFDGDGSLSTSESSVGWYYSLAGTKEVVSAWAKWLKHNTGSDLSVSDGQGCYVANGGGRRSTRKLARLFYDDLQGSVPLARKMSLASALFSEPDRHHDWSGMSNEDLLALRVKHGSWVAAGQHIGVGPKVLGKVARRHGLTIARQQQI